MIPWRVRNFLSEHFPLLYHYAVNVGRQGNNQAHWDHQLALDWNNENRSWPRKTQLIADLTKTKNRIIDIGCGNGSILRALKGRGYEYLHGLELSQYAIRRLTEEGIVMYHGELPTIPLDDAAFDVAIASQVLEHIVRRKAFLVEIRRILKPGGQALIFVPDNCLGPIDEPEHVVKFTETSLRRLVEKFFRVVEIRSLQDQHHPMSILFARLEKTEN